MKTNDDDNNMISSTTKDDSSLMKFKMTFPVLKLHPKTKGVTHVAERGYHMRLQNNTHEMTHKNIKMNSCCFLEQ